MRNSPPGFGFPIYKKGKGYVVTTYKNSKIDGFCYVDIEGGFLVNPSLCTFGRDLIPKIGDDVLYAFQFTDGTVRVGTEPQMCEWLKSALKSLKPYKYVMEDVKDFLQKK